MSKKPGLWANIHAKRKRIKQGSGERMRKPGSKGAPTKSDFRASQTNEENIEITEAARRVKLIKRIAKPHEGSKHFKTGETVEPQSKNSDDPDSRFDGTSSGVRVYKKDTPGQ